MEGLCAARTRTSKSGVDRMWLRVHASPSMLAQRSCGIWRLCCSGLGRSRGVVVLDGFYASETAHTCDPGHVRFLHLPRLTPVSTGKTSTHWQCCIPSATYAAVPRRHSVAERFPCSVCPRSVRNLFTQRLLHMTVNRSHSIQLLIEYLCSRLGQLPALIEPFAPPRGAHPLGRLASAADHCYAPVPQLCLPMHHHLTCDLWCQEFLKAVTEPCKLS